MAECRPVVCKDCPRFTGDCEGSNQEDCERRECPPEGTNPYCPIHGGTKIEGQPDEPDWAGARHHPEFNEPKPDGGKILGINEWLDRNGIDRAYKKDMKETYEKIRGDLEAQRDLTASTKDGEINAFKEESEARLELIRRLTNESQVLLREREGEVWYWQGDGSDHLESLSCPILIEPEDLKVVYQQKVEEIFEELEKCLVPDLNHPGINRMSNYGLYNLKKRYLREE